MPPRSDVSVRAVRAPFLAVRAGSNHYSDARALTPLKALQNFDRKLAKFSRNSPLKSSC